MAIDMSVTTSRRQFVQTGVVTLASLRGLNAEEADAVIRQPQNSRRVVMGEIRRIFTSEGERDYNAFTNITFWRGKYYVVFTQKTRHIASPPDGRLIVLESEDLREWSATTLPDAPGDDRDAKIVSTAERLVVYNTPYPHETMVSFTLDGVQWTDPAVAYPVGKRKVGRQTRGAQFWKPKFHDGMYYVACDYTNDTVDLLKSSDGLEWKYHATIMTGSKYPRTERPTETAIVFLRDGSCLAMSRLNDVEGGNCIAGFSIAKPPYESWDFTLGQAIRFGGQAVERFDDTIVVAARAEIGQQPGQWDLPIDHGWNGMRTAVYTFNVRRMRLELQAILPSEHRRDNSYCGVIRTRKDRGIISWYDGDTTDKSDVWIANFGII